MKVLALDISETSTGWFAGEQTFGRIQTASKDTLDERLVDFRKQIAALIKDQKPKVVVVEDVYLRWNPKTFKQLSMFQGVAREVASSKGARIEMMTATQARKYCCGKQEAKFKKPEVFAYIVEKYGLTTFSFKEHNDITDAAALWLGFQEKNKETLED